jgi:hypothetical protein
MIPFPIRRLAGRPTRALWLTCVWMAWAGSAAAHEPVPRAVQFNRDIRPILSDACFQCHGPDKSKRKADLRFDLEENATADRGGYRAIDRGHPDKSEMVRRITAREVKERMPPASTGHKLNQGQVELIRNWIAQGARYEKHWTFIPPGRPNLPTVKNKTWPKRGLDYFVLVRLEQEGLTPSPEAARTTLIRRVTLDLTGLPPTPAEVDAFLADQSPDAYEKVVDRLLKSPRYGERIAFRWLDAARYADTNGYQTDGERSMWRWRDWVIDAFNSNMPFDQFTIEQIAGDMLPGATLDQKIATGFNRNHRGNSEGGVIPEEYAVEYVVDRVDTTSTVWLGLTMGCAKCHDHKYDPISQKEFYQVFAYFNNVPEKGKAIKYGNSPPYIKTPTRDQQAKLKELHANVARAEKAFAELQSELASAQARWEKSVDLAQPVYWSLTGGLVAHFPLDGDTANLVSSAKNGVFKGGRPGFAQGRVGQAARLNGTGYIDAGDVADFGFFDKFSLGAWIYPTDGNGGAILSRMADTARSEGYALVLESGKVHVHLIKRWLDDAIRVETERALEPNRWHHVMATYDGSRLAEGVKIYVDGKRENPKVNLDDLNQSFATKEPLRIGRGGDYDSLFRGFVDDVRIYDHALAAVDVALVATPEAISDLVAIPSARRTQAQAHKLRSYFLEQQAPDSIQRAHHRLVAARKTYEKFDESIPTTMVMEEMPTPRDTHVLIRGEYDKKGAKVRPGIPANLPPLPPGAADNRLGFAKWLVDPANPLTARVTVNRTWQMYFGAGIVPSVEDFGAQGEWPSHPDLLDWLATELVRNGWDMKALHKTIVTSATYRQSSKATKALLQKDPDNRLLARGPRLRLPAETIRDQALFVSGLLVEKLGGPSVRPYQPPGLVKELHGTDDYKQDHGPDLYRRSLYTFWKRTVPPPEMTTFDAANRETCVVRASRTNTPLQALNLMNDVTYVEAARLLAQRVMIEGGKTPEERLTHAFRLCTSRPPTSAELKVLLDGLDFQRDRFRNDPKGAARLLSVGESPPSPRLDQRELAAYAAMASLILNLDEVITKE